MCGGGVGAAITHQLIRRVGCNFGSSFRETVGYAVPIKIKICPRDRGVLFYNAPSAVHVGKLSIQYNVAQHVSTTTDASNAWFALKIKKEQSKEGTE